MQEMYSFKNFSLIQFVNPSLHSVGQGGRTDILGGQLLLGGGGGGCGGST